MAFALINNTIQAIYEAALVEFFQNALVRDGMVVCTVQGKRVAISEGLFAGTFELPLEGLTDIHEVPQDLVFEARNAFSYDGKLLCTTCNKREMLFEFHLLNDILAKTVTVKDMVTPATRQPEVNAVQICVLLKNAPDLELGESKEFPPLKILTAMLARILPKTIIFSLMRMSPRWRNRRKKKKAVSKKRPATTVATPVAKRNRTTGRAAPEAKILALVTVAQEAVPIRMILAVTPPSPKRKAPKRKLKLAVCSDDEIVEKEPDVENVVKQQREKTTADDVDKIIDVVISETAQIETDLEEPSKIASFTSPKQFLKEPLRSGEDDDMFGLKQPSKIIETSEETEKDKEIEPVTTEDLSLEKSVAMMTESEDTEPLIKVLELTDKSKSDEESMSIDDILKQIPADMMLPSMTVAEITKIKFGLGIEILEVNEGAWYKASLPRIATLDKGKAPLVAKDEIKGHPAREMFSLICADIDFLVHLREKVIADVVSFFHSFSRLADLDSVKDIITKEEQILAWAETDSLETAVRRRDSRLFEGVHKDHGAVIARSNTKNRSLCWIRTKTLVDGTWFIHEGNDFWKRLPKPSLSLEWHIPAQWQFDYTLAPISEFFKLLRKQWADVYIDVVQIPAFSLLQPVGSHNFCRDIIAVSSVVDLAVDPVNCFGVFCQGLDLQVITSESSSSSSSQPDPISPNDSFSQRHLDTVLTSRNLSISSDSRLFLTIDDIPLGVRTAVDQILMPAASVTPQDFIEPMAQL
ncbi:splicing factor 3B subunit 1-like [Dorcoceras hygrometricum]|uniref:Splicing factor 3B subunit 1-like n=1 Tax=Dorcoceras hygrometricum TaxID=472368 RepID=A0A2Z7CL40_9LAMI|nr:splicing factor 3B subunit 1-like [Dorcoceras hygrometricum]